jgi:hypothetical protein
VEELQEKGLNRVEAVRITRLQFGGLATQLERTRDMEINAWLESAFRNLRYAVRSQMKTPAFTITVVLTLALGIGVNSAVFSAIYAVVLRPLPFPDGDQLVSLAQFNPKDPQQPFVAPARLEDWNSLNGTLQAITGYYAQDDSEISGELPEKVRHAFVAPASCKCGGSPQSAEISRRQKSGSTDRARCSLATVSFVDALAATRTCSAKLCVSARFRFRSSESCRLHLPSRIATWISGRPAPQTRHTRKAEP